MRNITLIVLAVGLIILSFYVYSSYQFSVAVGEAMKSVYGDGGVKEQLSESKYGIGVEKVNKQTFQLLHEEDSTKTSIVGSNIKKNDGVITVFLDGGSIIFEDYYDKNCMACGIEHEVIGKYYEKPILIIRTELFRSSIFQLINLQTGRIDTLPSIPILSPNSKLAVVDNYVSKDSLTEGIRLYSVSKGGFKYVVQIGQGWVPRLYYWNSEEELIVQAIPLIDKNLSEDEKVYLRINI